jgi:hypothetical protein
MLLVLLMTPTTVIYDRVYITYPTGVNLLLLVYVGDVLECEM